jgi:hypothetical protein
VIEALVNTAGVQAAGLKSPLLEKAGQDRLFLSPAERGFFALLLRKVLSSPSVSVMLWKSGQLKA